MVRREFLAAALGGAAARPRRWAGGWRKAREIVRSGSLGEVSLCRVVDGGGEGRRFVNSVFDGAAPVTTYERANGGEGGVWFYGSEATLLVREEGLRVWRG